MMTGAYKRKPVTADAILFAGENPAEVIAFVPERIYNSVGVVGESGHTQILIRTMEHGDIYVVPGMWLVRELDRLFVVTDKQFWELYETNTIKGGADLSQFST